MPTHDDRIAASAFWITDAGIGEIHDTALPLCQNDTHVLVRTLYSAISRGTESLVFNGAVPTSEYTRMRAPFQTGEFPFPVKYGYINVGVVEQGPQELVGKTVFCLYPHQTHYVVPISAVTVIPEHIPAARAVLSANLETAVNVLWDAAPAIGDRISVVGAGLVGSLVAWLAGRIPGCEVELVDINPNRAATAKALGVTFKRPDEATTERDLVIHASASEPGLCTAINLAGFEASVIELSWYGNKQVTLPLGGAFHSQRLQLRSSQVGHVATTQRARWDYSRRLQLALSLLENPTLDQLISGESHFNELPATFKELCGVGVDALCHRIRYDHAS